MDAFLFGQIDALAFDYVVLCHIYVGALEAMVETSSARPFLYGHVYL